MGKMGNNRKKTAPAGDAADPGAPESLDKVRDILFGGQMRTVQSRLKSLEERLLGDHQALRTELGKQLADLDAALKREAQALNERLATERARRAEELKALAAELKDGLRGLEKRHAKLEEVASLADAEIRDQILQQSAALAGEIASLDERLGAELAQSVQRLDTDKVDAAALAGLLGGVASELAGDRRRSGKGGARS